MFRNNILACLISLAVMTSAAAQEKPFTSEITLEVFTDILELTEDPQSVEIQINCNLSEPVDFITLDLPGILSVMSLVSAKLNNEPLWLIQSESKTESLPNIISWNFEQDSTRLNLYPGDWAAGYSLYLEIQVSLTKINDIKQDIRTAVSMKVGLPAGVFTGGQSGRGNQITFQ